MPTVPGWLPACRSCGVAALGFPAFAGGEEGPRILGAIAGPWTCRCGAPNCLSTARWVREDLPQAPGLPWKPPPWTPRIAERTDWELVPTARPVRKR